MGGRVAVLSAGIWRLRAQVQRLTDCQPVRPFGLGHGNFDCVAGWGMKATGERARRLAERLGRPYLSIEDGFLRSIRPGQHEPPISLVMDRSGVHYDARRPSDLEALIAESVHATSRAALRRARAGIGELRRQALSKYNDGPRPTLEQLFAAVYLEYARYFSPYDGQQISFEQAIQILAFLRHRFLDNSQKSICFRVSRWKRPTIDRLLDGIGGRPEHAATITGAVRKAKSEGARIVTWASRSSARLEEACRA